MFGQFQICTFKTQSGDVNEWRRQWHCSHNRYALLMNWTLVSFPCLWSSFFFSGSECWDQTFWWMQGNLTKLRLMSSFAFVDSDICLQIVKFDHFWVQFCCFCYWLFSFLEVPFNPFSQKLFFCVFFLNFLNLRHVWISGYGMEGKKIQLWYFSLVWKKDNN